MKKLIFSLSLFIIINSCASIDLQSRIPFGKYNFKGMLSYEELELKPNGTFLLKIKQPFNNRARKGKWKVKSKNVLILNGVDVRKLNNTMDSLFYEELDCNNIELVFENKRKINRGKYYLTRMRGGVR